MTGIMILAEELSTWLTFFKINVLANVFWADVIELISSYTVPAGINSGGILPIDEYVDFKNDPRVKGEWFNQATYWKGRYYGLVSPVPASDAFIYNLNLFSQLGLPDLNDIYKSGNWTWDTFLDVAKKGTVDFNSDGVMDVWGFTTDGASALFATASNGEYVINVDVKTGTGTVGLNSPKGLRALQFLSQLVNVDKVMPQDFGRAQFYLQKVCMIAGNMNISREIHIQRYFQAGFAPYPKGPDTDKIDYLRGTVSYWTFPINTRYRDLIGIINLAEVKWDPNAPLNVPLNSLAKAYTYLGGGGDAVFARDLDMQLWAEIMTDPILNFGSVFGVENQAIQTNIILPIIRNQTTPQSALNQWVPSIQSMLNNTLK